MLGKPKTLTSVDILHPNHFGGGGELDLAYEYAKQVGVDFSFVINDSISFQFDECDLLFIDTWHTYRQLISELNTHESRVKKYIVLHDTTSYAYVDEGNWASSPEPNYTGESKAGLWPAVEDFLAYFTNWELHKRYTHNNGLSVLKRK
jgi:hypothetical protein